MFHCSFYNKCSKWPPLARIHILVRYYMIHKTNDNLVEHKKIESIFNNYESQIETMQQRDNKHITNKVNTIYLICLNNRVSHFFVRFVTRYYHVKFFTLFQNQSV